MMGVVAGNSFIIAGVLKVTYTLLVSRTLNAYCKEVCGKM